MGQRLSGMQEVVGRRSSRWWDFGFKHREATQAPSLFWGPKHHLCRSLGLVRISVLWIRKGVKTLLLHGISLFRSNCVLDPCCRADPSALFITSGSTSLHGQGNFLTKHRLLLLSAFGFLLSFYVDEYF